MAIRPPPPAPLAASAETRQDGAGPSRMRHGSRRRLDGGQEDGGSLGEPLMDISQTAERLGVTVRFVRRLVAERRIPHYKLGHFIRFDPVEVNEWLREQHRPDDAA
jgi:excisionase family DNA binding protein